MTRKKVFENLDRTLQNNKITKYLTRTPPASKPLRVK